MQQTASSTYLSCLEEVLDDVSPSGIIHLAEAERAGGDGGLLSNFTADFGVVDDGDQLLDGSAGIVIQQRAAPFE